MVYLVVSSSTSHLFALKGHLWIWVRLFFATPKNGVAFGSTFKSPEKGVPLKNMTNSYLFEPPFKPNYTSGFLLGLRE